MSKPSKKGPVKYYRLRRPFFNGKVLCEKDSIQPFPEGKAPSGAVEVSPTDLKAEALLREDAQDTVIKAAVERYLDENLADLVEEVLAQARDEGGKVGGPPAPASPPSTSAK